MTWLDRWSLRDVHCSGTARCDCADISPRRARASAAQTHMKNHQPPLRFANRHALITGATGTGKIVTLQRLAEQFSTAGVPVFAADVKGDLLGVTARTPVQLRTCPPQISQHNRCNEKATDARNRSASAAFMPRCIWELFRTDPANPCNVGATYDSLRPPPVYRPVMALSSLCPASRLRSM